LYQNTPNPFTHDTEIRFFIPEEAQKSNLYVFTLQGRLLMNKPLNTKGNGSLTINSTELKPGMYVYSLHIDGIEVDSKRMVLTE
jgi:hypothetical protein